MNKIFAPFIGIGALLLAAFILAEVVASVAEFFAWFYLTKQELESALSTGQVVAADTLTHIITYTAVGALFSWLRAWDSEKMSAVYFVISEILSLGLIFLLRWLIAYYCIFLTILGVVLTAGVVLIVLNIKRKKEKVQDEVECQL
jgi:hypothetical protein